MDHSCLLFVSCSRAGDSKLWIIYWSIDNLPYPSPRLLITSIFTTLLWKSVSDKNQFSYFYVLNPFLKWPDRTMKLFTDLSSDHHSGRRPSCPTQALLAVCAMYPAPLSAILALFFRTYILIQNSYV